MERVSLPRRELPRGSVPWDSAGKVSVEHRAALDAAAEGARIVLVAMADASARRALLLDWARRNTGMFPGGRAYADLDDFRVGAFSDPSAALAWLLDGLGVRKELIPARPWERAWALRQVALRQPVVVILDGAQQAAEVRGAVPPRGVLLVGSERRLDGRRPDGAVQLDLDGPEPAGAVAPAVDLASLRPAARTLCRRLGSLPVRTTSEAMATALAGAGAERAVVELRAAGLLEDGGRPGMVRLGGHLWMSVHRWARSWQYEEKMQEAKVVTDACLEIVEEAAATLASPAAADAERRTAWETLDREQYLVNGLLEKLDGRWPREEGRLVAALLPLYEERTYSSWWRDSYARGIAGASWEGAVDVQAERYAQLARLGLRYEEDDEQRYMDEAADRAQDLLGMVGSDRVRGRIWQSRAEVEERRGRDAAPGWQEALRCYQAAGEHTDADTAAVRLGEALVAGGQAERALAVLAGGAAPSGARASLGRAAALRVLERPGQALAEAVASFEEAVREQRYQLCDQALRLLCELATEQRDDRLLALCRGRRAELGEATGLGALWLEAGPYDPADGRRP
ncbi:hypothetical protein [Streptomyces acidiscabies]|uniref:Regulatory protein n=1 Tax=Streptomyces acidiscabies TaxID=42234 RepID=A0ABU4MAP5_9ACTN|nr:hypothetical protein [Streptomyces acidiscabies]MDX3024993.1 hypothetical protein [Streptomyces acidiscabies]